MDKKERHYLEEECRYLCKSVFNIQPQPYYLTAYVEAHQVVFQKLPCHYTLQMGCLASAIKNGYDLEAIEYALRRKNRANILTKKMHILLYIIETHPLMYSLFVNHKDSVLKAYCTFFLQTIRSFYKLMKGQILLSKMGVPDHFLEGR